MGICFMINDVQAKRQANYAEAVTNPFVPSESNLYRQGVGAGHRIMTGNAEMNPESTSHFGMKCSHDDRLLF